jgi:Uma2 family endonuclease
MNSQPIAPLEPLSLDEYLEFEGRSAVRHEFVEGELFAFAGASRRHSLIVSNIVYTLVGASRGGPCEIHSNDVKLQATERIVYYPDVMVVCDPDDSDDLIVMRPCLVIEVVSPSSQMIDNREKLFVYRQIESLETYLIVDQTQRRVLHHWRTAGGDWRRAERTGDAVLAVTCLSIEISLDQIYEGIG